MSWLLLEMSLDAMNAERVEAALHTAGALSVTFDDAGDTPVYQADASLPPLWNNTRVTGLFPADIDILAVHVCLLAVFALEQLPAHRIQLLQDREWTREWLKEFKPMRFGRRLWICPTTYAPPDPAAVNILLDPGLAFGTGTHATTALCLEWLEGTDLTGKTVIDYGCGSGILAIAAARLGAERVWAVDTDPQALTAAHANATRNQAISILEISLPGELKALQTDVLLANILTGALQELAPRFAELVRPGGTLLLSGILSGQQDEIQALYAPWFQFCGVVQREEWLRMDGLRRKGH
ncbi:MAG TPA: 50S ribosomal protein L11 methyltransferase [Gammaproteobacteria bacterium]|nr:50S ribosomal protein L11 methyltransferase [Gammaproteobacteria bacterium]